MNEKTKKRILLIYSCVLSALLIATGVLFIVACIGVYNIGDRPFTRPNIAAAFSKIAPVVYTALAALVIGAVLHIAFGAASKDKRGPRARDTLKILRAKLSYEDCDGAVRDGIEKERRLRAILYTVDGVLLTLSIVYPLIYIFNPATFPANDAAGANSSVAAAMIVLGIFLIPSVVMAIVNAYLCERSMVREAELIREELKAARLRNAGPDAKEIPVPKVDDEVEHTAVCAMWKNVVSFLNKNKSAVLLGVRCGTVALAVVFIVLGIFNGGMADVLAKAVKICTECIGMG